MSKKYMLDVTNIETAWIEVESELPPEDFACLEDFYNQSTHLSDGSYDSCLDSIDDIEELLNE